MTSQKPWVAGPEPTNELAPEVTEQIDRDAFSLEQDLIDERGLVAELRKELEARSAQLADQQAINAELREENRVVDKRAAFLHKELDSLRNEHELLEAALAARTHTMEKLQRQNRKLRKRNRALKAELKRTHLMDVEFILEFVLVE